MGFWCFRTRYWRFMSVLHLFVVMFHCFKLINTYWSYTQCKEQKKRAIEHKIKRYYDYQSAGLITFLISSPQHLPPAVLIEKQSISKYLTCIANLKVKATPLQIHLKLKETKQRINMTPTPHCNIIHKSCIDLLC